MGIVASGLVYTTGACMWLHLGVNKLQRHALLPRVSTIQWLHLDISILWGLELHLNFSTLKRPVLHLDISTPTGHELHVDLV